MICSTCKGGGSLLSLWGWKLRYTKLTFWLFFHFCGRAVTSDGRILEVTPYWWVIAGIVSHTCKTCNGWGCGVPYPHVLLKEGICPLCYRHTNWEKLGLPPRKKEEP